MFVPKDVINLIMVYKGHLHYGDVIAEMQPFCKTIRYIEDLNQNCTPFADDDPFSYIKYTLQEPVRYNRILHMIHGYARPFGHDFCQVYTGW